MSPKIKENIGFGLIVFTALLVLGGVLEYGAIAQDVTYHFFSDSREIWFIPNFWNVVSNIPFVIVGYLGLYKLKHTGKLNVLGKMSSAYILLFFGTLLVGFGSGYYHLAPVNQTLVWDRLPMTIAFMALFSIIISEFISVRSGKALLFPLILVGVLSVIYWHLSEINGEGDLRYYVLVQFYPILSIPVILLCFRSVYTHIQAYWWLLLTYIVAKLFEYLDGEIYDLLGFISGHTLKHVFAALGIYVLLIFYQKRIVRGQGIIE
ncbi:MAG: ceramidase domain-containing protein [Thiohalomonadales bacterium]